MNLNIWFYVIDFISIMKWLGSYDDDDTYWWSELINLVGLDSIWEATVNICYGILALELITFEGNVFL